MTIFLEALMMTLLSVVLIYSSYTDCKYGLIYNSYLQKAVIPAIAVGALYYFLSDGTYFFLALENLILLAIVALGFYGLNIWAGGDSKLLLFIGLCIPGRIYALQPGLELSGMLIVEGAFVFAFVWLICRGLFLGIRNGDIFRIKKRDIPYKRILASYFMIVGIIQVVDIFIRPMIAGFFIQEHIACMGIYCMLILGLISIRDRMTTVKITFTAALIWLALVLGVLFGTINFQISIGWRIMPLVLVFALILLRMILEKYNYRVIPTAEVKAGQILSLATVMDFSRSRVQGLPQGMTEDLRSRITEKEAESVRRWEHSKYGKSQIVIVQKLPFGIFLAMGVLAFFVYEVVGL